MTIVCRQITKEEQQTIKNSCLRDWSLFSGGGRAANFGGRVTIFLTQIWGGPLFFNLDLGEGYEFSSLYIFSKSQ